MNSIKDLISRPVGVIGAGSFGSTIAFLVSANTKVLMYSRQEDTVRKINETHLWQGVQFPEHVQATSDMAEFTDKCTLIFPVVPSKSFTGMMQSFSPHLRPEHILIHATKGFGLHGVLEEDLTEARLSRENVRTMSEIILEESCVLRIGCVSGPNLSKEILDGQPAAAVIASRFDEVREAGRLALDSPKFAVFGSTDLIGAELAGALKNIIALGSGILGGLSMGKNIQAMLITRGLREMIYLGQAMGATARSFLGTAGIGDLIATATSENSRNYTFGVRLAKGETMDQINNSMPELVEGVRTLKIVQQLSKNYQLSLPIMNILYKVIYEGFNIEKAMIYLMRYAYDQDVDFV